LNYEEHEEKLRIKDLKTNNPQSEIGNPKCEDGLNG
jgi:hypothetical protein